MKIRILLLLFSFCFPAYSNIQEVKTIKTFFKKLAFDLENTQEIQKEVFNNKWYGSSESSREIIFNSTEKNSVCLHFRKNKITVYKIKHQSNSCISSNGYSMSFVNYSYRGVIDKFSEEGLSLYALEINAQSKFFYLPLLNIKDTKSKYQKWDTSARQGIIPGVKFLE